MSEINIDNSQIKNNKTRINYTLFKEDFYKAIQRIDTKKFCNSKEAAVLFDSIENAFSFPKIVKNKLEKEIDNEKLLNVFLSYASSTYCKNKIEPLSNANQKLKVKVNIDFNRKFNDLFENILTTYTNPIKHEILLNEQNNNFNSLDEVINYTNYYFDSIVEIALNEKEKFNSELKKLDNTSIKFDNFIIKGFNTEKIESEEKEKIIFSDVGGLKDAKREFTYLSKGLKNPDIYKEEGTNLEDTYIKAIQNYESEIQFIGEHNI